MSKESGPDKTTENSESIDIESLMDKLNKYAGRGWIELVRDNTPEQFKKDYPQMYGDILRTAGIERLNTLDRRRCAENNEWDQVSKRMTYVDRVSRGITVQEEIEELPEYPPYSLHPNMLATIDLSVLLGLTSQLEIEANPQLKALNPDELERLREIAEKNASLTPPKREPAAFTPR